MENYLTFVIFSSYYALFIHIEATKEYEPYLFDLRNASFIYKDFIKRFNRTFRDYDDYYQRYLNFVRTLKTINNINKQPAVKQKVLPNKFADWSDEERRSSLLRSGKRIDPELKHYLNIDDKIDPSLAFPGSKAYKKLLRKKATGRTIGSGIGKYTRRLYAVII